MLFNTLQTTLAFAPAPDDLEEVYFDAPVVTFAPFPSTTRKASRGTLKPRRFRGILSLRNPETHHVRLPPPSPVRPLHPASRASPMMPESLRNRWGHGHLHAPSDDPAGRPRQGPQARDA